MNSNRIGELNKNRAQQESKESIINTEIISECSDRFSVQNINITHGSISASATKFGKMMNPQIA